MALKSIQNDSSFEKKNVVLKKALFNACESLSISRTELAEIIGLSAASLSRLYDGKRDLSMQSKEGELVLLLLRLYRSLDTLFGGNEKQTRIWLRNYNTHLNDIPANLIQTIQGLMTTVMYLDAMRAKI